MITAALAGELDGATTHLDPTFGLDIPDRVEGVPDDVLAPRTTWADPEAFDAQARKLAAMFVENFRQFEDGVGDDVKAAAPKVH